MALIKSIEGTPEMRKQSIKKILLNNLPPYFDAGAIKKEMAMVRKIKQKSPFDFNLAEIKKLMGDKYKLIEIQFGLLAFLFRASSEKATKKEKAKTRKKMEKEPLLNVILFIDFGDEQVELFTTKPPYWVKGRGYLPAGELPPREYQTRLV